jgi:hypothetical protein
MRWRVRSSPRKWGLASNGGGGNRSGYFHGERHAAGSPAM